ncbi:MAG: hypothetical protein ACOCVM_01020 [Desulfovibrionaceae bacterium]
MTRCAALLLAAVLLAAPVLAPGSSFAGEGLAEDFARYARTWVASLNARLLHGPDQPRCVQVSGGEALGRFQTVDPASIETSVIPAGSGGAPAVGILRYTLAAYASRNATCEQAVDGPFRPASSRRVTELFVRLGGGWRPGPVPTGTAP